MDRRYFRKITVGVSLFFTLISPCVFAQATNLPTFLVFSPSANLDSVTTDLEARGGRVRQTIPPQILIADLPSTITNNSVIGLTRMYRGVIPINDLQPLGLMAVAAGVQWNRGLVKDSHAQALGAFGAMAAQVAQQSLPSPKNLTLKLESNLIHVTMDAVPGALLYHVQASLKPDFSTILTQTHLNRPDAHLALPEGSGIVTVYVRARAADRSDATSDTGDIAGNWTNPSNISVTQATVDNAMAPPVLTSPQDQMESEGFTVILEWAAGASEQSRVQISKSSSFDTVHLDEVVTDAMFPMPSAVTHVGDTYYWRVKRIGVQNSAWSNLRQFKIGAPRSDHGDVFVNPEAPR